MTDHPNYVLTEDDAPLFPGFEPPEKPEHNPSLSAGQRLTLRQAADISVGRHPLTGGTLHELASRHRDSASPKKDPFTCGSCYFRSSELYHNTSYPKCWLPAPGSSADKPRYTRVTHGPATDVRAWWPACPDYSPGDSSSPDAARYIPEHQ
ncbi:MAG TPA: hypothetical protein VIQ11_08325 [Mycobacterium sp.]